MSSLALWGLIAGMSPSDLESEMLRVQRLHFPNLADHKIEMISRPQEGFFFSTFVKSPWLDSRERTYQIFYSPEILEDPPPQDALSSILIHELQHIEDYTKLSLWQLIKLALRYEIFPDDQFIRDFEHRADRRVVDSGAAPGLKRYREWAFQRLEAAHIARHRQVYMTPEDLTAFE